MEIRNYIEMRYEYLNYIYMINNSWEREGSMFLNSCIVMVKTGVDLPVSVDLSLLSLHILSSCILFTQYLIVLSCDNLSMSMACACVVQF